MALCLPYTPSARHAATFPALSGFGGEAPFSPPPEMAS